MELWSFIGLLLASYSVVANDSVQTLGTWISSNRTVKWWYLWGFAGSILLFTLWYGWTTNSGDVSYGRLDRIPYQKIEWYHALAPGILLLLTKKGIPVSTSFLILSTFASSFILEKMLLKSIIGYAVAGVTAYSLWYIISKFNRSDQVDTNNWIVAQWLTTGLLWFTWLSHDIANITVFLPREISFSSMIILSFILVLGLAYMFSQYGGSIQHIIQTKHNTNNTKSATIIDLVYWLILLFFKELNNIPMSTTWVFVGLLTGRELAMSSTNQVTQCVYPILIRDFLKMMIGLCVSVVIIILIQNFK